METFDIKVNGMYISSKDIHSYLIKGHKKKAEEFVCSATKCDLKKAKEVVDYIQKIILENRDEKIET